MRVVLLPRALQDLVALRAYIARNNPAAAEQIADRIERAIGRLADAPRLGRPGRVSGTRELVITGTPYIAAYRARPQRIEVLRIVHGARRWPRRF